MITKAVVAVAALELVAVTFLDPNVLVNVGMVLIAVMVAWPLVRSRRKDGTITDLEKALHAKEELNGALEADLAGAQQRANQAEEAVKFMRVELAAVQAKYEEQQKYTAQGAVTHMEELLVAHSAQVAERHEKMLTALDALTDKIVNNGDG